MTFWSLGFLYCILPIAALINYLLPQKLRIPYIAVFSVVTLYAFDSATLILLLNLVVDYFIAKQIEKSEDENDKTAAFANFKNLVVLCVIPILTSSILVIIFSVAILISASYYHHLVTKDKLTRQATFIEFVFYCVFIGKLNWGSIEPPNSFLQKAETAKFNADLISEGIFHIALALTKEIIIFAPLTRLSTDFQLIMAVNPTIIEILLLATLTSIRFSIGFSAMSDLSRGISLLFSINLKRTVYYPLQAKGIYEYLFRFNISFATLLEDMLSINEGKYSQYKKVFVAIMLSALVSTTLTKSAYGVLWAMLMTVFVFIEVNLPIPANAPLLPKRIATLALTIPSSLLILYKGTPLFADVSFSFVISDDFFYALNGNYIFIILAFGVISSVPDLILKRTNDNIPFAYSAVKLVYSLVFLMLSTSFMLVEVLG